jgi:hypothetical protein
MERDQEREALIQSLQEKVKSKFGENPVIWWKDIPKVVKVAELNEGEASLLRQSFIGSTVRELEAERKNILKGLNLHVLHKGLYTSCTPSSKI